MNGLKSQLTQLRQMRVKLNSKMKTDAALVPHHKETEDKISALSNFIDDADDFVTAIEITEDGAASPV